MPNSSTLRAVGATGGIRLQQCLCAAAIAFVTWALLSPDPYRALRRLPITPLAACGDFVQHLIVFAVLTGGCVATALRSGSTTAVCSTLLIVYAVATESLQSLVPGRTPDPWDLMANTLGIGLGLAVVHVLRPERKRPIECIDAA